MQLSRKALDSQQIIDNHVFIIYLPSFSVIISIESFVSLLLQLFIFFPFIVSSFQVHYFFTFSL